MGIIFEACAKDSGWKKVTPLMDCEETSVSTIWSTGGERLNEKLEAQQRPTHTRLEAVMMG